MSVVRLSLEAQEQFLEIMDYWLTENPQRALVFEAELEAALALLRDHPESGEEYKEKPGIRRKLLRTTNYYVYYDFQETNNLVEVCAIWSTKRREGPPL